MTTKIRSKARAVPDSHEWGFASTGTEQVGMRVVIADGELAGQEVTWYGYFTDASEARTLEALKVAGWDGSNVIDLPGLGSTEFELTLEEETDEKGNTYLRPTFINRIGVAMRNKMDDAQKAAFAARMRSKTSQPAATRAPRTVQTPATARPAVRPAAQPASKGQFDEALMPENDNDPF